MENGESPGKIFEKSVEKKGMFKSRLKGKKGKKKKSKDLKEMRGEPAEESIPDR